jgi:hypothetical protein
MRHLLASVHAAIGPAGRHERNRMAGNFRERRFRRVLQRTAPRLGLPAEEATAVVLQSYGNAGNFS